MQYLAKITGEQRNGNLWKYDFIDIEIKEESYFYHTGRLNDIPHLSGKLDISFDVEEQWYFLQSFTQIDITAEEYRHLQNLISLERKQEESIQEVENDFTKRKKKKLTFREINYLQWKGLSRKDIADYANVSIWTVNRIVSEGKRGIIKSNKKRGRQRKIKRYCLLIIIVRTSQIS